MLVLRDVSIKLIRRWGKLHAHWCRVINAMAKGMGFGVRVRSMHNEVEGMGIGSMHNEVE
jgi:hypothetical protein